MNKEISTSLSSSSSSSNQPKFFKDLTDASMFCMIDLPIDKNGNFPFTAVKFEANLKASPEYGEQFLTVELRDLYRTSACNNSIKTANRLQPEFIKIRYHHDMTIKKFGEAIRDYARQTHGRNIRWNVLQVCISSYSLV
jgi:hypothetical protein